MYSNLVQELKSDGTLSSEISDLFTYMSMTPSQDLRCSPPWRVCKTCIMSISSSLTGSCHLHCKLWLCSTEHCTVAFVAPRQQNWSSYMLG